MVVRDCAEGGWAHRFFETPGGSVSEHALGGCLRIIAFRGKTQGALVLRTRVRLSIPRSARVAERIRRA